MLELRDYLIHMFRMVHRSYLYKLSWKSEGLLQFKWLKVKLEAMRKHAWNIKYSFDNMATQMTAWKQKKHNCKLLVSPLKFLIENYVSPSLFLFKILEFVYHFWKKVLVLDIFVCLISLKLRYHIIDWSLYSFWRQCGPLYFFPSVFLGYLFHSVNASSPSKHANSITETLRAAATIALLLYH